MHSTLDNLQTSVDNIQTS